MKERAGKTCGSYCIRTGIERGLGTTGSVEPWRFTKSGSATGSLSRPNQQKKRYCSDLCHICTSSVIFLSTG